jgi:hypothetical protein
MDQVNSDFQIFAAGPLRWLRDFLNAHPRFEHFASVVSFPVEAVTKKAVFGCQTCGQCLLHFNGLTCPMQCPKNLRNGPCGGTRKNGHCEAYPERWCVWYLAYRRSQQLPLWKEHIYHRNAPVDWQLASTGSVVNWLTGRDAGSAAPKAAEPKPKAAKPQPKTV